MDDIYIACKIEQGVFPSERIFQIHLSERIQGPEGETTGVLQGTAHQMHLLNDAKQALEDGEPPFDNMDGFVRCMLVRELPDNFALVEVPSADLIHVPKDELVTVA